MQPFVDHAEALLSLSHRLLGSRLTEAVVKATFFAHFCAGEDVREVRRTAQRLQVRGGWGRLWDRWERWGRWGPLWGGGGGRIGTHAPCYGTKMSPGSALLQHPAPR